MSNVSVYPERLCSARGQATNERRTMRSLNSIEMTLPVYAGHSALDAALKPACRQWTEQNSVVFGGRQVGLM